MWALFRGDCREEDLRVWEGEEKGEIEVWVFSVEYILVSPSVESAESDDDMFNILDCGGWEDLVNSLELLEPLEPLLLITLLPADNWEFIV